MSGMEEKAVRALVQLPERMTASELKRMYDPFGPREVEQMAIWLTSILSNYSERTWKYGQDFEVYNRIEKIEKAVERIARRTASMENTIKKVFK